MQQSIKLAYDLSTQLNKILEGISIRNVDNKLFPTLFHSTVIDHHKSIIILIEKKLFSSASTLLRPLFEAFVKGLWFSACASEKDFDELRDDKFNKIFTNLVSDVENNNPLGLEKQKKLYWRVLNSLTHTGTAQLSRKISGDEIKNNHDTEFLKQILNFSGNYALLSCGELAKFSENKNTQNKYLSIASEWQNL